jgi:hypothetical protein
VNPYQKGESQISGGDSVDLAFAGMSRRSSLGDKI